MESLHSVWGSNLQQGDQESHAQLTEPARLPINTDSFKHSHFFEYELKLEIIHIN